MRVLVVDDSRLMRMAIRGVVEGLGLEVAEAANGAEALRILHEAERPPDLVLLDWNMPVLNGHDTLASIRADDRLKDIPVMMVTTESERDTVAHAITDGARWYLSKPFSPEDLSTMVLEALGCAEY